jgi:ceramide glucosyltransferase
MIYPATLELLAGILGSACFVAATLGCAYLVMASIMVLRRGSRAKISRRAALPVSVLVPLCGDEPYLERRVEALCSQRYDAPVQIIWGVQDPSDPAIGIVRRALMKFPRHDTLLNIDPAIRGRNRKVANLANMLKHARHDTIVALDSDIHVGPDYLSAVVGALQEPGVGAATCLYHGVPSTNLWSRLAALGIDLHFLPSVCVALAFGLAQPCFGSTMAMHRRTLDRIGAFSAFAEELFDDNAIGEAVRQGGDKVKVLPLMVAHVCHESSARELAETQLRYARTIRAIDPIGNAGAIITHPFPVALVALALGVRSAGDLALLALVCRLILCICVEQAFGLPRHSYWLVPVRDILSFGAYSTAFLGNTVVWRGHRYHVPRADSRVVDPDGGSWMSSVARVTRRILRWNRASS